MWFYQTILAAACNLIFANMHTLIMYSESFPALLVQRNSHFWLTIPGMLSSPYFFFSFPFRTAEFAPEPGFAQSSDERRWLPLLSCSDTGGGKHLGFDSYTGMSVFSATTWSVAFDTPATSLTSSELQEHMTDCILTSHILFGETFL